ncbi:MAG: hypothetical protein R3B84_21865 [Zavarzinella sp.]
MQNQMVKLVLKIAAVHFLAVLTEFSFALSLLTVNVEPTPFVLAAADIFEALCHPMLLFAKPAPEWVLFLLIIANSLFWGISLAFAYRCIVTIYVRMSLSKLG